MKRYSEYKDSGVKWIGEIPGHWNAVSLKRVVKLINEKSNEQNIPYIALENIESFTGKILPLNEIEPDSICNKFKKDDVLFCKLRPYLTKCVSPSFDGKCTSELLVLRNFNGVANYLKYTLLSPRLVMDINASTYGAKMPRANWNYIGLCRVPLPPLPEQEAIVTYLDTKVAKIDEYISIAEKKIAALEELKQTIIAEAVTRGIHKDVPMKDSGVKWIGMIPEHWDLKRTAMLFSENRKKNINYEFDHALKFNYGKLVSKNEIGDVSSLKETYMAYTVINKNDIAINCLNLNYDFVSQRVAISPQKGIITSAYLIITPRQGVEAMYYNYLFKAMDSKKLFHGMGTGIRLTLSFSELKKQQIPVPPLPEQQEIVTYLDSKVANINQLCQTERAQIEKLKEYKQRLISDVVTGKVKVMND